MPNETIRLTRRALYDLVWSEPMRMLSTRYAVSDVGLSKACRRMKVPVPGPGYWRRKEAGHPVVRERLPALPDDAPDELRAITLTVRTVAAPPAAAAVAPAPSPPPPAALATRSRAAEPATPALAPPPTRPAAPPPPEPATPATPVDRQAAYEADPAHRIVVAETLEAAAPLHPLVRQTQIAFRGARPIERGLVRPFIRDGRVPWGPHEAMERLQRASQSRPVAALDISVSPGHIDRALRLLDALLKALDARGYPVSCTPRRGRPHPQTRQGYPPPENLLTRVEVGDEDVFLVLREIMSKVERAPEPPPPPRGRRRTGVRSVPPPPLSTRKEYDHLGSGRFVLLIPQTANGYDIMFPAWRWEERATRDRLEEALGEVVVGVVSAVETFQVWRERRAAMEREAIERARRQAEAERQQAAEAARVQELERQLGARRTATEARAYVAELRAAAGEPMPGKVAAWVAWIEAYADRVDPGRQLIDDAGPYS